MSHAVKQKLPFQVSQPVAENWPNFGAVSSSSCDHQILMKENRAPGLECLTFGS